MYMDIVYITLGIVLLMLGKKLFWLFAGSISFIIGYEYAGLFLEGFPQRNILIIALIMAIIGIVLAFAIQKVGAGIAGFFAGGYVALNIVAELGFLSGWLPWAIFVIGGIVGAVLMYMIFDWAVIVLSSLSGAFFIVTAMNFSMHLTKILFVVLACIGCLVQAYQMKQ